MKRRRMTLFNLVLAIHENVWYFRPENKKVMIAKIRADRARTFIRSQIKHLGVKVTTRRVQLVSKGLRERYNTVGPKLQEK